MFSESCVILFAGVGQTPFRRQTLSADIYWWLLQWSVRILLGYILEKSAITHRYCLAVCQGIMDRMGPPRLAQCQTRKHSSRMRTALLADGMCFSSQRMLTLVGLCTVRSMRSHGGGGGPYTERSNESRVMVTCVEELL